MFSYLLEGCERYRGERGAVNLKGVSGGGGGGGSDRGGGGESEMVPVRFYMAPLADCFRI